MDDELEQFCIDNRRDPGTNCDVGRRSSMTRRFPSDTGVRRDKIAFCVGLCHCCSRGQPNPMCMAHYSVITPYVLEAMYVCMCGPAVCNGPSCARCGTM
jgi:hypothetical protein